MLVLPKSCAQLPSKEELKGKGAKGLNTHRRFSQGPHWRIFQGQI